MKKGSVIIAATVVALGIFFGMLVLGTSLSDALKNRNRAVAVKGLAEREVAADQVIWPLVYKEIGNDLPDLYKRMSDKSDIIIGFLKDNGLKDSEISISAPQIIDLRAERYGNANASYRYNITSVITVSSGQVEQVRKLMNEQAALLQKGVAIVSGDYQYNSEFLFTKLNELKPQMIEEATKNARVAAEQFAKDSDSELGKILNATRGQFSIEDRDANTPYLKKVRVVTSVTYSLED